MAQGLEENSGPNNCPACRAVISRADGECSQCDGWGRPPSLMSRLGKRGPLIVASLVAIGLIGSVLIYMKATVSNRACAHLVDLYLAEQRPVDGGRDAGMSRCLVYVRQHHLVVGDDPYNRYLECIMVSTTVSGTAVCDQIR